MQEPGQTKTDRAVREIRARIVSRQLRSGDLVRQAALASEMQLGITPVREALLQLASEGLVKKIPYVGVVVADMTVESTQQIYEVRRLLEAYATRQACLRAGTADIVHLRGCNEHMTAALAAGDPARYRELNQDFHMAIYRLAGNPALYDIIAAQWRRFPRDTLLLMEHRMEQSLADHRMIVAAFEQRDAGHAEAMMASHIGTAQYEVAALVGERPVPAAVR